MLAGGAGAAAATVVAHYFDVIVGDAVAAVIGFAAAYAIARRIQSRAVGAAHSGSAAQTEPAPIREPFLGIARPPRWATAGRRIAVVAGALALLFGDRALYRFGIHGLPRKLGAVAIATATMAVGFWLTRWPRAIPARGPES